MLETIGFIVCAALFILLGAALFELGGPHKPKDKGKM